MEAVNFIDMIGKKFGRLLVVSRDRNNKDGRTRWKCKCDCGNEKTVNGKDLRRGMTKSCGCYHREIIRNNLVGKKFGRFLVIKEAERKTNDRNLVYLCKCDCGNEKEVKGGSLVFGSTKSCGCYNKERVRESILPKHGTSSEAWKIYSVNKHQAKKRKLSFDITLNEFLEISKMNCF